MKKFSLTILFYCVLGLVFYSCCREEHRIIGSADLTIFAKDLTEDPSSGVFTIPGVFYLQDYHDLDLVYGAPKGLGMQQAHATQPCDVNLVNNILIEETELYFDQALVLNGDTLPSSSNILANSNFNQYIDVFHDTFRGTSSLLITLDSMLFSPPIFTDGPMNIRLVTKAEDGTSFESELDIIVDM